MNIEELRAAQTRERTTDGLQELRDSFYREVAEYIAGLRERRRELADAADDPFGDADVQSLTDEIETAEQVSEAIYERRMGKIVKQASLAAAGMEASANGLTDEERALYTDLVGRIEQNKTRVLDVLAGEADPDGKAVDAVDDTPDPATAANDRYSTADSESSDNGARAAGEDGAASAGGDAAASTAAAAMGDGDLDATGDESADATESLADDAQGANAPEPADEPRDPATSVDSSPDGTADSSTDGSAAVERETVRITQDVGEILGVDERAYTLESDDVVTLPAANAEPLLARDAAERLD